MGFKENIKARRLELNITLDNVSTQLGVSKPTIQRYESGVISNIPFDKIEKLSKILETTPSWLMGWEQNIIETQLELTEYEKILIDTYNSLDAMGKHTVETVLEMEFNRCRNL